MLFDLERRRWAGLPATHRGFAERFAFAADRFSYREQFPAPGLAREVTIEIGSLATWADW